MIHERKLRISHEMRNDDSGEVAARTTVWGVHLDTALQRTCPFDPPVIERAQALLARPEPREPPP